MGAFDITAANPSSTVEAGQEGVLAFTVTNRDDNAVRVEITFQAIAPTERAWLSLKDAPEEFAAGSTQQIIVKFTAPPGTRAGDYKFRMVVADLARPDDLYDVGPEVFFRLTKAVDKPPPPPPFPWWIVIAAGAVVVTGLSVFLIWYLTRPPGLGESCDDGRCGKGLTCAGGRCLGDKDYECKNDDQCVSNKCSGRCAGVGVGGICTSSAQCASPNEDCTGGKCVCKPARGNCDGNAFNGCESDLNSVQHCGGCGVLCASGKCGQSIRTDTFPSPDWQPFGATSYDQGAAVMTNLVPNQAGSIVYARSIVVRSAFTLEFRYSITQDPGATAGDGMAFMLANERIDHTFLGNIGGSLGVAGLKGFGVELDTYNNGQCGDIPDDHVGIMSLESCGAGFPKDLFPPVPVPLKNTSGTCTIVLAGSELTVSLNNRVVTKGVLPGYRPGVPYRFGFGAGTGAAVGRHAVSGVKLSFDSNRCL